MHIISRAVALTCTALFPVIAGAHAGHAHTAHHHTFPDATTAQAPAGVTLHDCWIRALPNRLPAAGYFRLENTGDRDAVLIGAQADGFGSVMLHTHTPSGGMSSMVHVEKVVVPAGGRFEFAPGGHHLMLEKPSIDLKVGTRQPVVLWFEDDKALKAQCDVRPPGTLN